MANVPSRDPQWAAIDGGEAILGTRSPELPADGEGRRPGGRLKPYRFATTLVTNLAFARFVDETGYITTAEEFGWSAVFYGLLPIDRRDGIRPPGTSWWIRCEGAHWRAPFGPGSTIDQIGDHPVVHVSWFDACAYAEWAGARLPSEIEWEHAARGGLADPRFPWGDTEPTDEAPLCNIWQGDFPTLNTMADGYYGTSPVAAFAPNGFGIHDMAGNVWEWTRDAFRVRSVSRAARERNKHALEQSEKVTKGGSFLCHKSYCYRYRIAARSALTPDSGASNVGFRVAAEMD